MGWGGFARSVMQATVKGVGEHGAGRNEPGKSFCGANL